MIRQCGDVTIADDDDVAIAAITVAEPEVGSSFRAARRDYAVRNFCKTSPRRFQSSAITWKSQKPMRSFLLPCSAEVGLEERTAS